MALPSLEYSALERESQANFENPGSIGIFDTAVIAVSLESGIIGIAVVQITARIGIDVIAASAKRIENIEISADREFISQMKSFFQSQIECGDRRAASVSILFCRDRSIRIARIFVSGIIRNVDVYSSYQIGGATEKVQRS